MEEGLDSSYQLTPAASVLHPTWISVISARVMRTLTETYGSSHRPVAQGPVPGGAAPELILTSDLVLPWHPLCGPFTAFHLIPLHSSISQAPQPCGQVISLLFNLCYHLIFFGLCSWGGQVCPYLTPPLPDRVSLPRVRFLLDQPS